MGLFDFLRRSKPDANDRSIVGHWLANGAEIDIRAKGTMDYVVVAPGKRQIMKLTYRIDGNEIVSNQPSAPREERTKFWFEGGKLVLMFGGERTEYQRGND